MNFENTRFEMFRIKHIKIPAIQETKFNLTIKRRIVL